MAARRTSDQLQHASSELGAGSVVLQKFGIRFDNIERHADADRKAYGVGSAWFVADRMRYRITFYFSDLMYCMLY